MRCGPRVGGRSEPLRHSNTVQRTLRPAGAVVVVIIIATIVVDQLIRTRTEAEANRRIQDVG